MSQCGDSTYVRTWRGFGCVGSGQLVQHPVVRCAQALLVFLSMQRSAMLVGALSAVELGNIRSTPHLDGLYLSSCQENRIEVGVEVLSIRSKNRNFASAVGGLPSFLVGIAKAKALTSRLGRIHCLFL